MKKFIATLLLSFLCLASCWAEELSWQFDQEKPKPVKFSPTCRCFEGHRCTCGQECNCDLKTQASGEEWFTQKNGHLFHEKTGWYWNPAKREFYRVDIQPQPVQFAPMPAYSFGGFQGFGGNCPPSG
jgi:hypothetical protein